MTRSFSEAGFDGGACARQGSDSFSEVGFNVNACARQEPDSLSGAIFALEGVAGATVLLNGPTGCKYYHAALSESQSIRTGGFDPLDYPVNWYFGQPRVPSTYLDNGDYVYGSERKLEEALAYFRDAPQTGLLCIVNAPGAALIGDDLEGIARRHLGDRPFLTMETPGFSAGLCAGHERAVRTLVDCLIPPESLPQGARPSQAPHSQAPQVVEPLRVNVLGMSLYQRYYTGDVMEIRELIESMGLTVGCMLCAGSPVEEVRALPRASLNVVVHPELGTETARYLQERFGTPFYVCDGAPVGFAATESFARDIADITGADAQPVLDRSRSLRKRAYSSIAGLNSLTGLPKGVTFGAEGSYSQLYALTNFLVNYLALVPVSLVASYDQADCYREKLVKLLDGIGCVSALGTPAAHAVPELFFGTGDTIARLRLAGCEFSGVETALPTLGYLDVVPKTFLGLNGALRLVEAVLNGLLF